MASREKNLMLVWTNRFFLLAIVLVLTLLLVSCGSGVDDSGHSQNSINQSSTDHVGVVNEDEEELSGNNASEDDGESDDLMARIFAANDAEAKEKAEQGKLPIYDPYGEDRDCEDFDRWEDANLFYLYRLSNDGDVHELDEDGDKVPCESLPGSP
jgi:hypothetical protein